MAEQRGEPFLLSFPCGLPHTVQPLGHAVPALCRVHVRLNEVLPRLRPSLPSLRRIAFAGAQSSAALRSANFNWRARAFIRETCLQCHAVQKVSIKGEAAQKNAGWSRLNLPYQRGSVLANFLERHFKTAKLLRA
jgi:hypothetical protein